MKLVCFYMGKSLEGGLVFICYIPRYAKFFVEITVKNVNLCLLSQASQSSQHKKNHKNLINSSGVPYWCGTSKEEQR